MSLVNKMLRDLDARHIGDAERAALPAAVTPLAARQDKASRPPALAWGLVAVVALAAAFAWQELRPDAGSLQPATTLHKAVSAPIALAPAPMAAPGPAAAPDPATAPVPAAATISPAATITAIAPVPTAAPVAVPPPAVASPVASLPVANEPVARTSNPEAPPSQSTLRMAAELSLVPRAPVPAPKASAKGDPRPAPVKAAAPEKHLATEKPALDKTAAARPATAAPGKPAPVVAEGRIDKQERIPTAAERAEAEFRRASMAQRQGNADAALAGYRSVLELSPEHAGARQALAAQLIDGRRFDEAEDVLRKGTEIASARLPSTLALARLKVERQQVAAALDLLLKNAGIGEASAEYQGFTGALLNRAGRAAEAADRYRQAARLAPAEGRWWAGLGISLDAAGKAPEARDAYQRARQSPDLPPDLAMHVDQRLR